MAVFGATGMVGMGTLLECLDDPRVERVLVVTRQSVDISHPKLQEIIHSNFFEFGELPAAIRSARCVLFLSWRFVGRHERARLLSPHVRVDARRRESVSGNCERAPHVLLRVGRRDRQHGTRSQGLGPNQGQDRERVSQVFHQRPRTCFDPGIPSLF